MEIKVGEYVRTDNGEIHKVEDIEDLRIHIETEKIIWSRKDYIPKSKVKEKIEELNRKIVDAEKFDERIGEYRYKKYVLQELLED